MKILKRFAMLTLLFMSNCICTYDTHATGGMMQNLEVAKFLQYLTAKASAAATLTAYRSDLEDFLKFTANKFPLLVTRQDVRAYLLGLKARNLSIRTIRRRITCCKYFYRVLKLNGKIEINPFAGMTGPRVSRVLPKYLTRQEVATMLELPNLSTIQGRRDAALMETMYSTGIRLGEAVQIRKKDISNGEVFILGKGNRIRRVPIGRTALCAIEKYLDWDPVPDESIVFRSQGRQRMTTRTVERIIDGYLVKIGHPELSAYVLRHCFATHTLEVFAETPVSKRGRHQDILLYISEMLGHSSIKQTQVYLHVMPTLLRTGYAALEMTRAGMNQMKLFDCVEVTT